MSSWKLCCASQRPKVSPTYQVRPSAGNRGICPCLTEREPDKSSDDLLKQGPQFWIEGAHPAEGLGGLPASQRLASGAASGVIPGLPALSARVRTLRDVQRHRDERPFE